MLTAQYNTTKTISTSDKNQPMPPNKYSINLMWLNRTLDTNQTYILPPSCGHGSTADDCLSEVLEWQQSNPDASVTLWFDSQYVTKEAINRTQEKLQNMGSKNSIILRDIRDIPIVKNSPDAFSDNLPIYFRVDLMKFIICVHSIEEDKNQCAIFTDFLIGGVRQGNLKKMTKEELFSPAVLPGLEKYGLKAGFDHMGKLENQFLQVMSTPNVLNALKFIINICLNSAVTTLNFKQRSDNKTDYNIRITSLSNLIYNQLFKPMFLSLAIQGLDELKVKDESFNPTRHGYDLFGNTVYGERFGTAILKSESIEWLFPDENTNLFDIVCNNGYFRPKTLGELLGRQVYAAKTGDQHNCEFSSLIQRAPADGSKQFKCTFIPTREKEPKNKVSQK